MSGSIINNDLTSGSRTIRIELTCINVEEVRKAISIFVGISSPGDHEFTIARGSDIGLLLMAPRRYVSANLIGSNRIEIGIVYLEVNTFATTVVAGLLGVAVAL